MDSFTKDDQLCLACHFSIHRLQEYTKDDHLCIACLQTIHGLQNYVIHREINCPGRSDINKTGRKQTQTTNSCKNVVNTSGQPVTISKSALVATDSVTKLKTTKNNHSELTNSSIIDASSPASELIDSSSSGPAVKEENVPDDTIDEYMVKLEPEEEGQEHSDIVTAPDVSAPSRKKTSQMSDGNNDIAECNLQGPLKIVSILTNQDPLPQPSTFKTKIDENQNTNKHYQETEPNCTVCDRTFTNISQVAQHLLSKSHQEKAARNQSGHFAMIQKYQTDLVLLSPYQCLVCKYYFVDLQAFYSHLQSNNHTKRSAHMPGGKLFTAWDLNSVNLTNLRRHCDSMDDDRQRNLNKVSTAEDIENVSQKIGNTQRSKRKLPCKSSSKQSKKLKIKTGQSRQSKCVFTCDISSNQFKTGEKLRSHRLIHQDRIQELADAVLEASDSVEIDTSNSTGTKTSPNTVVNARRNLERNASPSVTGQTLICRIEKDPCTGKDIISFTKKEDDFNDSKMFLTKQVAYTAQGSGMLETSNADAVECAIDENADVSKTDNSETGNGSNSKHEDDLNRDFAIGDNGENVEKNDDGDGCKRLTRQPRLKEKPLRFRSDKNLFNERCGSDLDIDNSLLVKDNDSDWKHVENGVSSNEHGGVVGGDKSNGSPDNYRLNVNKGKTHRNVKKRRTMIKKIKRTTSRKTDRNIVAGSLRAKEKKNQTSRKCGICLFEVKSSDELKMHCLEMHREACMLCEVCDIVCLSETEYLVHTHSYGHKKKVARPAPSSSSDSYECEICHKKYREIKRRDFHQTYIHGHSQTVEEALKEMGGKSKTEEKYKDFLKQIEGVDSVKMVKCVECNRKVRKQDIMTHLHFHTNERIYRCKLCDRMYSSKGVLQRHLTVHYGINYTVCEVCGKSFKKRVIKSHMHSHTVRKGEALFECDICHAKFYEKLALRYHKYIHSERNVKCQVEGCSKKFISPERLTKHMRSHIRKHLCDVCGKGFPSTEDIKKHYIRMHTDERRYKCDICPYQTVSGHHLRRHINIHTGDKPYKCPYCEYSCGVVANLRKHIVGTKKHPGMKMYPCKFCSYATNSSAEYRDHLHADHRDEEGLLIQIKDQSLTFFTGNYRGGQDVAQSKEHTEAP